MKHGVLDSIDTAEINHYLKTRVLPILQPLQMEILEQKPTNVKQFAYQWLQKFSTFSNKKEQNEINKKQIIVSDDQESDEVFKEKIKMKLQKQKQGKTRLRVGVLGETSQFIDTKEMEKFQHSEETKVRMLIELRGSLLFKNVSHSSLLYMIDRMKPIKYQTGEVVIKQGDEGNEFFIVDEGFFKCIIPGKKGQQKIYGPGETFGELALLYNTKRASTIVAETDGRLFALGRMEFNSILRENVLKKNEMCDRIMSNIEIFQTLDSYEKSRVFEALQQVEVQAGKYVIREDQLGDSFYIVAEGKLVAQKMENNELRPVYYYKQGDYFGELALIKNITRQASVKTLTKRSAFKRLLGPIQNILKKNENRYKSVPKKKQDKRLAF